MERIDLAQEMDARYTRLHLDRQIRESRAREGLNTINCIECGMEIPEVRRDQVPGCVRCVFCQEDFERQEERR